MALDAKLEDSSRYFYETSEVERLRRGEKSYVIGRKGTGKTAIAHHITAVKKHDIFSVRLSLKNFPWQILYPLKDGTFPRPNEYITIWKYVIYVATLEMMAKNEAVDSSFRAAVKSVFTEDIRTALANTITKITDVGFSLTSLFHGFGVAGNLSKAIVNNAVDWTKKVELLQNAIQEKIDHSSYYLVFDDLDEDYKYQSIFETNRDYIEVITGLFKAIQDVRSIFQEKSVFPVVFLRDDIFDLIQDNDKTKLLDLAVNLSWTDDTIKPLISFRIERAKNKHYQKYNFAAAWGSVFEGQIGMGTGGKKLVSTYEWISRQTMSRPRDYIAYIRMCADYAAKAQSKKITPSTVTYQVIVIPNKIGLL